ncbi:nuclear receptor-binding factor 2-like [Cydia pomonella]|uniref:nuclear receptor-binding factor 2-like n=1 Tax=Cydia pomonella TaxID=82600 RepID=UPI002ADD5F3A|nr:nuclear receptor-binding factor 2-like [Cydia pomonella]
MESHPLNLAHQQHRRAEAHLINNRYDEAMQCHHNAAELLLDAMKSTTSSVALESITLQHSYHLKQKDLIKSKKDQYARVKKVMDNIKCLGKDPFSNLQGHEYAKLQVAIFRAINETDSLLHFLSNTNDSPVEQRLVRDRILPTGDVTDGFKTEKTQETVIEELRILSQNLHSLVEQLVLQVEVLKDENVTLKERVNYLEKERVRYLNLPSSDFHQNFSTLSMGTESLPMESAQRVPVIPIPTTSGGPVDPNFDLTALRE